MSHPTPVDRTGGARPVLAELTTLGLGGPARELISVTSAEELREALRADRVLILGGGSNLVVADAGVDATVVQIAIPGIRLDGHRVTIGAGVSWDDAVRQLVDSGLCGLATLSGIPGSAGATPIQNVGAYGTEIAEMLTSVTLFDRSSGRLRTVPAADLQLAYRSSALRGTDRSVVVDITLELSDQPRPVRYAELARTLAVGIGDSVPEPEVRRAVLALRRSKGMVIDSDDPDTRSAGSFFTNPILTPDELDNADAAIRHRLGDIEYPCYPAGQGNSKLSAAWLIERAGFRRGHLGPGGRVGLSTKHTLALVNRGGSTAELLALARVIRDTVLDVFAVRLQPEPVLVGTTLDG